MQDITASEAVFGFAAWLTCRKEPITISSTNDATQVVELVKKWCESNKLPLPRDGVYPHNLTHPEPLSSVSHKNPNDWDDVDSYGPSA